MASSSRSSWNSQPRIWDSAKMPVSGLALAIRAARSGEMAPWDWRPFSQEAAICLSVLIRKPFVAGAATRVALKKAARRGCPSRP